MGSGPERLLSAGLAESLKSAGHIVHVETIEAPDDAHPAEIRTAFELNRILAQRVRAATISGAVPVVLAGNCISALGTLAGLRPARCAVLWFDSHGDFNTPETTSGGFLDGMALATLTGCACRNCAQPWTTSELDSGFEPSQSRPTIRPMIPTTVQHALQSS